MLAFDWGKNQVIQHLEATWRLNHPEPAPPQVPPEDPPQEYPGDGVLPEQLEDKEEVDDIVDQAWEKKKPSIGDFKEDMPPPNVITWCLLQYMLQKIAAFEYIELWYFTKEGCFEAAKYAWSQADDTFGLLATS